MAQHYDINWLSKEFDNDCPLKFMFFWGHKKNEKQEVNANCFSQWYELPFVVDQITYRTAEHWMMAKKALLFKDEKTYEAILRASTPGEAKTLGRQVCNFDEQIWNEHRVEIVKEGNIHKFSQHSTLSRFLLSTGNKVLVEASPVDTIWGIGLSKDSNGIENPHNWRGLNLLGFVLMETRDVLKNS